MEFISGKLIAPPALNHDPSVKDIDKDDFDYHRYETSRRKKRVVSSVLTAGYDLKDLTNTGSSSIAVGIEVLLYFLLTFVVSVSIEVKQFNCIRSISY